MEAKTTSLTTENLLKFLLRNKTNKEISYHLTNHILIICFHTDLIFQSEQAAESVHSKFYQLWKNFKCDMLSPDYAVNLYRCVVQFCSQRLNKRS